MRRSQVKFGESIGIIIIVYLVVVVGFVWYNDINTRAINELYEEDRRNQAFERYYYIVNLDLIHVSQRGLIDEEFDLKGLQTLEDYSKTEEGREYLRERLGDANITVHLFNYWDLENINQSITLYENMPTKEIVGLETFRTLIPVVNQLEKSTHIGMLEVQVPITN